MLQLYAKGKEDDEKKVRTHCESEAVRKNLYNSGVDPSLIEYHDYCQWLKELPGKTKVKSLNSNRISIRKKHLFFKHCLAACFFSMQLLA